MPVQVFNLHLVSICELANDNGIVILDASLSVLKRQYPVDNAMVRHQCVTEDAFDIVYDFPLVIQLLVQVEKLLSLKSLDDLRLLDREALLLLRMH